MEENWYEKAMRENDMYTIRARASYYACLLRYDRAFEQDDDYQVYGDGEYHVYMWLHANGTPFYVGSGKGNRWKQSKGRNERFYEETKHLDTLVCKLVDGLTSQEAREAEFCLSHYLTYNGYKLANWDNNYQRCVDDKQAKKRVEKFVRLMKKDHNNTTISRAISKMIPHKMPCEYKFIREQYEINYGIPT
jgi:hypothetical protein